MKVLVDEVIIRALDSYRKENNLNTKYKLSKDFDIAESTIGLWYNKPNTYISNKSWNKIKDKIEPFIDYSVSGDENTLAALEVFDKDEEDEYVMARMAQRLGNLTDLVPVRIESLKGKKREAVKKVLEGLSELLD